MLRKKRRNCCPDVKRHVNSVSPSWPFRKQCGTPRRATKLCPGSSARRAVDRQRETAGFHQELFVGERVDVVHARSGQHPVGFEIDVKLCDIRIFQGVGENECLAVEGVPQPYDPRRWPETSRPRSCSAGRAWQPRVFRAIRRRPWRRSAQKISRQAYRNRYSPASVVSGDPDSGLTHGLGLVPRCARRFA
jgi:hypothetical protein